MKIAQQIRALLLDGIARTPREIYEALGTESTKTAEAVCAMATKGLAIQDKSVYPSRYSIGRLPPAKLSKEELMARERDRKRVARLRAGCRPLDQIRAERAAATQQRVKAAKVKPVKVPAPVKPKSISITPRALSVIEAKPEPVKLPCTDTWIRQNPDKVQRLPPGQWSHPLRFEY